MKIKLNDQVQVMTGKEAGKTGKVIQVFPKKEMIVVEGLNQMKRHLRAKGEGQKGQVLELAAPMVISKVMLICPKCGKPTRVGYSVKGKTKERTCKRCEQTF